jgi:type II secretory pathway component GspD/PulD (secretin)
MKCLFYLIFFFFSSSAFAETVLLSFDKVPLVDFMRAVYGEILKQNYVIGSEVVNIDKTVSMKVDLEQSAISALVRRILEKSGLSVRAEKGVFYIDLKTKDVDSNVLDSAVEVYRPRYRGVEYLRSLLGVVDRHTGAGAESSMFSPVSVQPVEGSSGEVPIKSLAMPVAGRGGGVVDDLLVLIGDRDHVDKLMAFLERVDVAPLSVEIRAALIEVSSSEDDSFNVGIALSVLGKRLGITFGGSFVPGVSSGAAHVVTSTVDAFVSAVAGDSRYRIITRPRLIVLDGATARLSVGSEVPTLGSVTYEDGGKALQSVEYRSSGVIMSVTARVFAERINLLLNQQVSNFAETATSGIDSPTLIKRELDTSVDVQPGQVLVMAGLDEGKESKSRSGPSWFPWLSRSSSGSRSELLLLVEVVRL